jgi:hypothetical protein
VLYLLNTPPLHLINHVVSITFKPSKGHALHRPSLLPSLRSFVKMSKESTGLTFALQALLVRHESYMAEAEQERERMSRSIEKLEQDKRELEKENAKMIEENRGLLNQLEDLNNATAESDAHLQSLTATLQAAQFEVKRLGALAMKTAQLEEQLMALEAEQQSLQEELVTSHEDERSAVQRWKMAESTLRNLQDQVERIEKEARDEREKHVELIGRMERRREVEKELDNAAGRLKGAAAAKTLGRSKNGNGTSVVSHFVRDILQDNANLQTGIVELREMLHASNEEVQSLREQVMLHQPLPGEDDSTPTPTPLSEELEDKEDKSLQPVSPELHVHHHYHTSNSSPSRKDKLPLHRRPKKKRGSMQLGVLTPSSGTQTPRTPTSHRLQPSPSSTASAILSQTSVSIPHTPNASHRWSMQSSATESSFAGSSLPSSPQTDYRSSSIFDRIDTGFDSSRPTSPESNGFGSPHIFPSRDKRLSNLSFRSISEPAVLTGQGTSVPIINPPVLPTKHEDSTNSEEAEDRLFIPAETDIEHPTIPEESEEEHEAESSAQGFQSSEESEFPNSGPSPNDSEPNIFDDVFTPAPRLRRSASHESLLSISGMDIHTLQSRPSQLLLGRNNITLQPRSNNPVVGTTNVIASTTLLASSPRAPSIMSTSTSTSDSSKQCTPTLTSRLGGWVWGRWGVAPTASTSNLRAKAIANNTRSVGWNGEYEWGSGPLRAPGINQRGVIKGLRPPQPTPSQIHAVAIDEEGLREAIGESAAVH